MRLLVLLNVLFLFACTEKKKADFSVANIPNPRDHGVFVSNPDHILSETTVATLNSQMDALDKEGTAYVAIVMLKTIGDNVPKDVAHEIFKLWQPGDAAKNNGLVVLFVEDQHRIEFETGYGLEGDLPDVICFRIQQQKMVPLFKQNDYDNGMIGGMDAVVAVLKHEEVTAAPAEGFVEDTAATAEDSSSEEITQPYDEDVQVQQIFDSSTSRKLPSEVGLFLYIFYIIFSRAVFGFFIYKKVKEGTSFNNPPVLNRPGFFSGLWIYTFPFAAIMALVWLTNVNFYWWTIPAIFYINWLTYLLYRVIVINVNAKRLLSGDRKQRYDALTLAHKNFGGFAFFFPIPLFFYHKWNQKRLYNIRNTPSDCEQCHVLMEIAAPKRKKQLLDAGQQAEEKLKSVSYDVWHCNTCSKDTVVGYDNIYTRATECPKCHYKTLMPGRKQVIERPTTSSQGSGIQHYECKHCGYTEKTPYVIARLSSSGSSSSGSSSSSSSSSSGSSSGGSSGGGGAGSSW